MPATTVKHVIFKIEVDNDDAIKATQAQEKSFKSLGDVGVGVLKAIAEGLADISINAVKNFAQFEDTLSHARRTMGLTKDETLALGDSLIALSTSFEEGGLKAAVSSDELAKISGILGQLGFSARENEAAFNGLVVTVAKVGLAFGMSNAKAAEGLGILQNLYNLPTEQLSNIASSIAYLGNTTVATAGQIMDIMQRVGGIAGILGVSAQDMAGIAATLREAGVSSQVAGTAMSQIFAKLSSDVDKFAEVLGAGGLSAEMIRFKIESGDATGALKDVLQAIQNINNTEGKIAAIQALKDLGLSGVRVQQTLLGLSNNIGNLNENLAKSAEAFAENTAINDAYEAAIDNTKVKMEQFWNIVDAIQKIIGKDLALAFSDFLDLHLLPFINHFKTWLETSKGAEAIFGQNGLIANGLKTIGEALTNSEGDIFDFLDNIDTKVPEIAKSVENVLRGMFAQFISEIEPTLGTIDVLVSGLESIAKAVNWVAEQFDKLRGPLEFWNDFVQLNRQTVSDFVGALKSGGVLTDIFEDVTDRIYGVNKATGDFAQALNDATAAGSELGKEMVYQSVLPDIEAATISLTDKTIQYGESFKGVGATTKFFYKTASGAWTNLSREVQDNAQAWFRSNEEIQYSTDKVNASLTQTGSALQANYMATLLASQGVADYTARNETLLALQEQINAAYGEQAIKRQEAIAANMAFVESAMAANAESMTAIAASGGLDAAGIQSLIANQMFQGNASGLLDAQKQLNVMNRQNSGIPVAGATQFNRGVPAQSKAQEQSMNVTLMMDDQEVGRFMNVAADRQQQNNRRSPGNNQAGRSGGRI